MKKGGDARTSGSWRRSVIEGAGIIALLVFAIISVVTPGSGDVKPEPRRSPDAAPGDCVACHDGAKPLPATHVSTKAVAWAGCRDCHSKEGKTLRTRIPLNHTHRLAGVSCKDCHEGLQPAAAVTSDRCLGCHGSRDDIVKATARLTHNPHTSPHYGPDLECDVCHHQHRKSENFCAQCHTWPLVVP